MPDTSFEADDKSKPGASSPSPTAAAPPPSGSQLRAVGLYGDDVPLRAAAVLGAADVRQDGAAGARRLAVGVGGRHLLLPGGAARRLLLRAPADRQGARGADRASSIWACALLAFVLPADRPAGVAGASRRPASPTCGSSGCSPWRSACRSWPSRPTRRCCRRGSPAPAIRTRHDPYFLYAASNLGSLIALLGYPFVLEPAFGLKELSRLWACGFVLLVLALGARSSADAQAPGAQAATEGGGAGRGRERSPGTPRRPGATGWAGSGWRSCRRRC